MRRPTFENRAIRCIQISLLCLCFSAIASAQPDNIDAYIEEEMRMQGIPGLSLAIVQDGTLKKAEGYGLSSIELGVPASSETLYSLGSVTKPFTATAIMLLVESGKIDLEARISSYLDGLPDEWEGVCVKHLLAHTSGIKRAVWEGGSDVFHRNEQEHEPVIRTSFGELDFQPGERFVYNNIGYRMLGMIIEKVSGKSYWEFLDDKIFKPTGMTVTRNSDPNSIIPNRSQGYVRVGTSFENRDAVTASSAFSSGGLMSSVLDLAKWDAVHYTDKLLTASSRQMMWTPTVLNNGESRGYGRFVSGETFEYGLGWAIMEYNGRKEIGHGGGLPGYSAFISRFVDDGLTVIVLANCQRVDVQGIARGVAELAFAS